MSSSTLPPANLAQNRQNSLYASSTIPYCFAVLAVTLRCWCRWHKKAGFWYDDWLVLCAFLCATGLSADLLWWIPRGLGRHVETFGPNVDELFAKGLFVAEITYTGVIVFVKFSILALYWRIFNKTNIRLPIAILGTAVLMWGIAVFLLTILQCIPTRGFWDKTIHAACHVDSQKFLFAISIPNILIDVALLTLPVPYIKRLNVSDNQKKVLISISLLGSFVCIASIMRLVAVLTEGTDADVTWNLVNQAIWAVTEADFAIIGACLPTLRPFWLAIRPRSLGSRTPDRLNASPSSSRTPRQKRTQPSDDSVMLKSSDDEEILFSSLPSVTSRYAQPSAHEPQQTAQAVAVPHSTACRPDGRDARLIKVENAWDVEYDQQTRPRQEV